MDTQIRHICGPDVGKKLKKLWGLNSEGEINGAWRDLGVPNLWMMCGASKPQRFASANTF
jgi:hypothetical protein